MVMGRQVKLHPAMVIVSFLIFDALLGFVGVLLAVPSTVLWANLPKERFPDEPPQESLWPAPREDARADFDRESAIRINRILTLA